MLIKNLHPNVLEFQSSNVCLGDELRNVFRVHRVGAWEAVIFYSARILDSLAASAVRIIGFRPAENVFANLQTLQFYNLISTANGYWVHALRGQGNAVRHLLNRIADEDAELALLFVEMCLRWFFQEFPLRDRLAHLTVDGQPLILSGNDDSRQLIDRLSAFLHNGERQEDGLPKCSALEKCQSPTIPALLADLLVARKQFTHAQQALDQALARWPTDSRLLQLRGLTLARQADETMQKGDSALARELLSAAVMQMEPLYKRSRNDEEAAGILAGIYKRRWRCEAHTPAWLERSYRAYRDSWKASKCTSPYLGINVAATALWRGRANESRELAEKVRTVLEKRAEVLSKWPDHPDLVLNFWDQVTLAEAWLLLEDLPTAKSLYQAAFKQHPKETSSQETAILQLQETLNCWGKSINARAWFS